MALFTAVKEGSSVEAYVFPGVKPAAATPAATPKQQSLKRGDDGTTTAPEAAPGKSKSAVQRANYLRFLISKHGISIDNMLYHFIA